MTTDDNIRGEKLQYEIKNTPPPPPPLPPKKSKNKKPCNISIIDKFIFPLSSGEIDKYELENLFFNLNYWL